MKTAGVDMQKYCSLNRYLELNDKALYEIFEHLCMFAMLRPRGAGITLIRPGDKIKKTLQSTIYGANPEEAVPIVQSLVIHRYLPTTTSWSAEAAAGMTNALRIPIKFKTASGNKVTFIVADAAGKSHEFTVVKNAKFEAFSTRGNMAVWDLEGDAVMPVDGQKLIKAERSAAPSSSATSAEHGRAAAAKKKGSSWRTKRGGGAGEHMRRHELAEHLLAKFSKKTLTNHRMSRCFVKPVVSMLIWLQAHHSDVFEKAKACLDWSPEVTFFLLFEPFCAASVIPEALYEEWLQATRGKCGCAKADLVPRYIQLIEASVGTDAEVKAKLENRKKLQAEIMAADSTVKYKATLSDYLFNLYGKNTLQACRDEMRFVLFRIVKDIDDCAKNDQAACKDCIDLFTSHVKMIYGSMPAVGEDKPNKLTIMNQRVQNEVDVQAWYSQVLCFVRSSAFMFVLVPMRLIDMAGDLKQCGCKEELSEKARINLEAMKKAQLLHHNTMARMDIQGDLSLLDKRVDFESIKRQIV